MSLDKVKLFLLFLSFDERIDKDYNNYINNNRWGNKLFSIRTSLINDYFILNISNKKIFVVYVNKDGLIIK